MSKGKILEGCVVSGVRAALFGFSGVAGTRAATVVLELGMGICGVPDEGRVAIRQDFAFAREGFLSKRDAELDLCRAAWGELVRR